MKRANVNSTTETTSRLFNNPQQQQQQFNELFSSLPKLNRNDLFAFIDNIRILKKEAMRLISLECSQVVNSVPEDVWKTIFLHTFLQDNIDNVHVEEEYQKLSCVSNSWSTMIQDLVRINFDKFKLSNWLLFKVQGIEALDLSCNEPVVDETVMRLTNLKELNLKRNTIITDKCVMKMTQLKSLDLSYNDMISDLSLRNMKYLNSLLLWGNTKITDKGVESLPLLSVLSLNGLVSNEVLKKCTNLTELCLSESLISDEAIKSLVKLRKLTLFLGSTISYQGYSNLSDLSTLEFSYNQNIVDDELKCMTNLTSLRIYGKKISNVGIQSLSNLTKLHLGYTDNIDDDGIKNLTLLTHLILTCTNKIGDEGIKDLTNLVSLDICDNRNISAYGIKKLTNLKSLLEFGQ